MALLNSSLLGLIGLLPPRYLSAFMLGVSLNAVFPLWMRVITLMWFGIMNEVKYFQGAVVFFGCTGFFLGVCALGVHTVVRQNVIIFNLAQTLDHAHDDDDDDNPNVYINKLIDANNTVEFNEAVFQSVQSQNKLGSLKDVCATQKRICMESFAVVLVYLTSLICYPGLILQTRVAFIKDESWFQVFMLALYSAADIGGRFAIHLIKSPSSTFLLILLSILRIALIFTSLQIGLTPSESTSVFNADWFKIVNTLLLGIGNGLLGTLLIIIGTYKVGIEEAERAGQLMALHMTVGRGIGSMISGVGLYKVFK